MRHLMRYRRLAASLKGMANIMLGWCMHGLTGFLCLVGLFYLLTDAGTDPMRGFLVDCGLYGAVFAFAYRVWQNGFRRLVNAWKAALWQWRVDPKIRLDLARHEAGHALLGRALGLPYVGISLTATMDGNQGAAILGPRRLVTLSDPCDIAVRIILSLVAGKAAEKARRLQAWGIGSQTDDLVKAYQIGLLLEYLGTPGVCQAAQAAVPKLFAEPRWRAALDAMALIARERDVSIDELDATIDKYSLTDGLDRFVAAVGASQPEHGAARRQTRLAAS